jgi:hypothetical protein
MLAKDKSTFDGMFGLEAHTMIIDVDDQDDSNTRVQMEGETDDNPIHLHGDTAEEFGALLWSLYALYVLPIFMAAFARLILCLGLLI